MNMPVRPYDMRRRAEKAAATGERILDAAVALFWERPTDDISLDAVAERASVTAQTVIRRFGGKDGLFASAAQREFERVAGTRDPAAVSTVREAVRQLVDHYDEMGDRAMRLLAEEIRRPSLRTVTDPGRQFHRSWCAQVFRASLVGRSAAERRRRLAQLVAITDVYTWKLLRRDAGLNRAETELALIEMVEPLTEGT
jgi:AcrR family transcriptional regulator